MARDTDDLFDEDELSDGFGEEVIADDEILDTEIDPDEADELEDPELDDDAVLSDDVEVADLLVPVKVVAIDDSDIEDDDEVELALDEIEIVPVERFDVEDDEEDGKPTRRPASVETFDAPPPKQPDEFKCRSCHLLKNVSQLADADKQLCRDCV